jgi:hypothetical protein
MSQKIRMISSRGTSSHILNDSKNILGIRNKNTVKRISKTQSGQRLTTMRGTRCVWLNEQPKQEQISPNKITLVVQRGTKKITLLLNSSLSKKITLKIHTTEKLVCNACNCDIDSEICRTLVTRNANEEPQFFAFHFFFPCWNMHDFFQKHPKLTLDKTAFSIPEDTLVSEHGIKDLQTNLSHWIDSKWE